MDTHDAGIMVSGKAAIDWFQNKNPHTGTFQVIEIQIKKEYYFIDLRYQFFMGEGVIFRSFKQKFKIVIFQNNNFFGFLWMNLRFLES